VINDNISSVIDIIKFCLELKKYLFDFTYCLLDCSDVEKIRFKEMFLDVSFKIEPKKKSFFCTPSVYMSEIDIHGLYRQGYLQFTIVTGASMSEMENYESFAPHLWYYNPVEEY
jgi:hypothetical protein